MSKKIINGFDIITNVDLNPPEPSFSRNDLLCDLVDNYYGDLLKTDRDIGYIYFPYSSDWYGDEDYDLELYVYSRRKMFYYDQNGLIVSEPAILGRWWWEQYLISPDFYPDHFKVYFSFYEVSDGVDPQVTFEFEDQRVSSRERQVLASATFNMSNSEYHAQGENKMHVIDVSNFISPRPETEYYILEASYLYYGPHRPTHMRVITGNHGIKVWGIIPYDANGNKLPFDYRLVESEPEV